MGIVILGAGLGLCLALVEQVLRRAWVQVQSGRQEGRIYLLAHPECRLGLDERAEIGIFGDAVGRAPPRRDRVDPRGYVLHHLAPQASTRVNGGAGRRRASPARRRPDRARAHTTGVPTALIVILKLSQALESTPGVLDVKLCREPRDRDL